VVYESPQVSLVCGYVMDSSYDWTTCLWSLFRAEPDFEPLRRETQGPHWPSTLGRSPAPDSRMEEPKARFRPLIPSETKLSGADAPCGRENQLDTWTNLPMFFFFFFFPSCAGSGRPGFWPTLLFFSAAGLADDQGGNRPSTFPGQFLGLTNVYRL